jgi:plastocyanin
MAATVTGTVRYEGKIPRLKKLDMRTDPGCVAKHKAPPQSRILVLGEGNTIGNIFVRVKDGLADQDFPVPSEPEVLDQKDCFFLPRVSGVMVGQDFKILNSDGLMHNVHSFSELNTPFNFAMPASLTETVVKFEAEEGMFKIKCDVHPWMGAFVTVMTHPFYDTTDADGKFTISGLPAGTYEIEVWHEKLGTKSAEVTVGADETGSVDFTLSPPSKKRGK